MGPFYVRTYSLYTSVSIYTVPLLQKQKNTEECLRLNINVIRWPEDHISTYMRYVPFLGS